jgi:hypothetical protein
VSMGANAASIPYNRNNNNSNNDNKDDDGRLGTALYFCVSCKVHGYL